MSSPSQDMKDIRSDLIALFLCVCIVGGVALCTVLPINAFANMFQRPPVPSLQLSDASARLNDIITNYDVRGSISSFNSRALDPKVYEALTRVAPDNGAINDLLNVADLVTQFNDGAGIDTLREAAEIVNDVKERMNA
jgi:hypothetical protein